MIFAGAATVVTFGFSCFALARLSRMGEESRTTMAAVVTLTRWFLATQQQLHAVRRCGESIEAALGELDERMEATWAQRSRHLAAPDRRGRVVELSFTDPVAEARPVAEAGA